MENSHPPQSGLYRLKKPAADMGVPDKEVFFIGEQPHDAKVSCGCLFAMPTKFRGKINLRDEIIVYVNALDSSGAWTAIFSTNSRNPSADCLSSACSFSYSLYIGKIVA